MKLEVDYLDGIYTKITVPLVLLVSRCDSLGSRVFLVDEMGDLWGNKQ